MSRFPKIGSRVVEFTSYAGVLTLGALGYAKVYGKSEEDKHKELSEKFPELVGQSREQKQAMQYGNVKRMTVKEHSERVRFDHNLIDQYIPNNNFKRIYPLDPGCGGLAPNGDELEELYVKLEKSAQTVWKKQVGMIQNKNTNPNVHENVKKKKRRKNQKGILTSMTSHIKDPKQP